MTNWQDLESVSLIIQCLHNSAIFSFLSNLDQNYADTNCQLFPVTWAWSDHLKDTYADPFCQKRAFTL